MTLVVSVLGSRALWTDTRRLLEYGFRRAASVTASSTSFVVQITSFLEQGRAESLRERITRAGYPAYVERAVVNIGARSRA